MVEILIDFFVGIAGRIEGWVGSGRQTAGLGVFRKNSKKYFQITKFLSVGGAAKAAGAEFPGGPPLFRAGAVLVCLAYSEIGAWQIAWDRSVGFQFRFITIAAPTRGRDNPAYLLRGGAGFVTYSVTYSSQKRQTTASIT